MNYEAKSLDNIYFTLIFFHEAVYDFLIELDTNTH